MARLTRAEREKHERDNCPACRAKRAHTEEEWANHPLAGHGYCKEQGYTHPIVKEEANDRFAK